MDGRVEWGGAWASESERSQEGSLMGAKAQKIMDLVIPGLSVYTPGNSNLCTFHDFLIYMLFCETS